MKNLIRRKVKQKISKFDPELAGQEIAASEKAIQVALKQRKAIQDPTGFEKALQRNLSAKLVAARVYKVQFPGRWENHSTDLSSDKDRTKFCTALGFSERTIQRWINYLIEGSYEEYFDRIRRKLIARYCAEQGRVNKAANRRRTIVEMDGLYRGDFRELSKKLPDNSVDLIFTDPPYKKSSLIDFADAAAIANRVLIDGGSFLSYCGHYNLPEIIAEISKNLRFWWICACVHAGNKARMWEYGVIVGWKPILWFVKGTRIDKETFISDVVSGGQEKSDDSWQQAESEAAHFIDDLVPQGGIVVDFFAGSGTTLKAAKTLGRRAIGFDL